MCYNCGCFSPKDDMGNDKNITESTFKKLSEKWGKSLEETKEEILKAIKNDNVKKNPDLTEMFEKASKAWGQSIDEAIGNTKDLLEQ